MATPDLLTLTAQIVAGHVAANKLHADEMSALINDDESVVQWHPQ